MFLKILAEFRLGVLREHILRNASLLYFLVSLPVFAFPRHTIHPGHSLICVPIAVFALQIAGILVTPS